MANPEKPSVQHEITKSKQINIGVPTGVTKAQALEVLKHAIEIEDTDLFAANVEVSFVMKKNFQP